MQITIFDSKQELGKAAASLFAAQILTKKDSVLGFATGSSPLETYAGLIDYHQKGILDFSAVQTYNLDEYVGLEDTHPQSYAYFMNENLFSKINIRKENCHLPNGMAKDTETECLRYEGEIRAAGGIDLQLLGIGHNGHIGFNEPSGSFANITNCVTLTKETIDANKRFFASAEEVPKRALSMGIGTIMRARAIVMVVNGADKADVIAKAVRGAVTPEVPASILQFHPQVTLLLDKAAAGKL